MAYIYKVTNIINNKIYIGKTIRTLKERQQEHLRKVEKEPTYFHNSIIKYGKENFIWEIIEECPNEKANEREIFWIAQLETTNRNKGYNLTTGGEGYELSQEIKDKISKANTGKKRTLEQCQHLSEVKKNLHFHHSEETKKLMSLTRKGRKLNLSSEERARRKLPKSEKFKITLSEKMKGRILSEETRKKISESKKAYINLYCSNDIVFHSWEEVYNYLITNNLSIAKEVSICRNTIYTVLDKEDRYCYGLKWKTTPFLNEKEKVLTKKICSEETRNKISEQKRNKNELVTCYNNNETKVFNSRLEAYEFLQEQKIIKEDVPYSKFSSKIGEASSKKIRHKGYYWKIEQKKDVETIEKDVES